MTRLELRISGVESDRSTNCATATTPTYLVVGVLGSRCARYTYQVAGMSKNDLQPFPRMNKASQFWLITVLITANCWFFASMTCQFYLLMNP